MERRTVPVLSWLTEEISARPLAVARIGIGVAASIRAFVALPVLLRLAEPGVLQAPHFTWTPAPSVGLAITIFVVWIAAAVAVTFGWRLWLSGTLLGLTLVSVLTLDQQLYGNHLYLMTWLVVLLVVADAGAALSPGTPERQVVRWPTFLLMIQVSIVYGFAGVTKLNEDFLSGRILAGVLRDGVVGFPEAWRTPRILSLVAIGAVVVELFLAIFLWFPGLRPAAFILGLGLHTSIAVLMAATDELVVFAILMLATYPLFLDRRPLVVLWDDQCASCRSWVDRFKRLDVMNVLEPQPASQTTIDISQRDIQRSLHAVHFETVTKGFAAITRILEHLVPTLWFAPILRLPGLRSLGERWYRWQASRRACAVGERT